MQLIKIEIKNGCVACIAYILECGDKKVFINKTPDGVFVNPNPKMVKVDILPPKVRIGGKRIIYTEIENEEVEPDFCWDLILSVDKGLIPFNKELEKVLA